MRHYKTLKGLLRQCYRHSMNFNEFKMGFMYNYLRNRSERFELSKEAYNEAYELFANAICSKRSASRYADLMSWYNGRLYCLFERMTINLRDGKVKGDYCTGQDYISETRTIMSFMRKGN